MAFELAECRFRAMNTGVAAWLWAEPGPADIWLPEVEAFFTEVEAELSRFRPDSGLSRLNAAAGQGPQPVSAMLSTVLGLALDAQERTQRIFDPTVLPALTAAGYDRSFELLSSTSGPDLLLRQSGYTPAMVTSAEHSAPVELDRVHRSVTLAAGVQIDLGGIAKGWTVDRAATMLGAWGPALVDAGGDIRATGAPGGELWPVAVEDPFNPDRDLALVKLAEGAIATSSVLRRHWQAGERTLHHLIDPRTREPSAGEWASVTVLAPTTVEAEVAAKVALILGRDAGRAHIEQAGLDALMVDRQGRVETVGRDRFRIAREERLGESHHVDNR